MRKSINICVFSSVPPPFHGSNYMTKLLLESKFCQRFNVTHINTSYVSSLDNIGKLQLYKLGLCLKYLRALLAEYTRKHFEYVIITPTFTIWPFLRDSLTILLVHYLTSARIILWTNSGRLEALYLESKLPLRWYIRFALKKAFHVVTAGRKLRNHFTRFLPGSNVSAIPNGIPPSPRRIAGPTDGSRRTIIYLSNLLRSKGWFVLLQAARKVCAERRDVIFKFYGSPSVDSPLQEINEAFERASCPTQIQYLGPVYDEEKEGVFDEADIFCLPTFYSNEALPLSVLEAMQHRLAVITTDAGAITEAITDGEGGLIVPKNNADELAAAINRLLDNKDEIVRMGKANEKKFEMEFHIDVVVEKWCVLIERLEGVGPGPHTTRRDYTMNCRNPEVQSLGQDAG